MALSGYYITTSCAKRLFMGKFSVALDETLKHFKIRGKAVAEMSGLTEQNISKFRLGQKELTTGSLESILDSLPQEVRNYMLFQLFVQNMSDQDLANLLSVIASKLRDSDQEPRKELELALR